MIKIVNEIEINEFIYALNSFQPISIIYSDSEMYIQFIYI